MSVSYYINLLVIFALLGVLTGGHLRDFSASGPLKQVTVDYSTNGTVYVGGRNVVVRLPADLSSNGRQTAAIGGPQCQTSWCSRDTNDVSVLHIHPAGLLVCGTRDYGACRLHNMSDVTQSLPLAAPSTASEEDRSRGLLGSRTSALVVLTNYGASTKTIHSAMAYDGRPTQDFPAVFSARRIRTVDSTKVNGYMRSSNFYLKYNSSFLDTTMFEFIHGFYDAATYRLFFLRQESTVLRQRISVLSRIYNTPDYRMDYGEGEISCTGHRLANAAFLDSKTNTLYVVFSSSNPETSVLCAFRVNNLRSHFDKAVERCSGQVPGYTWPYWLQRPTTNSTRRCSHIPVRISKRIEGVLRFHNSGVMTSVSVKEERNLTVAYLGYSDGKLQKIYWPSRNDGARVLMTLNVSDPINRNMVFSKDKERLYMTHGNTVSLLNTTDCGVHTSCTGCLGDTTLCTWCVHIEPYEEKCVGVHKAHECHEEYGDAYYSKTCPPSLTQLSPLSGPADGGSILTLAGELGHLNESQYLITVGGRDCSVLESQNGRILCETASQLSEVMSDKLDTTEVYIRVTNSGPFLDDPIGNVPINGSERFPFNFEFKVPNVTAISPTASIQSGSIPLTIKGAALDIGSSRTITVGGRPCRDIKELRTVGLVCRVPAHPANSSLPVVLTIDKTVLESPVNLTYLSPPVLEDIHPTYTTASGGTFVTLSGRNLQGLGEIFIAGEKGEKHVPCLPDEGLRLKCRTAKGKMGDATPIRLSFANIYGSMDSVLVVNTTNCSFIDVVPDPVVDRVEKVVNAFQPIVIKGSGLDVVSTDDITVTIGNNSCAVGKVTSTAIQCRLALSMLPYDQPLSVKVWVGYQESAVGSVEIPPPPPLLGSSRQPEADPSLTVGIVCITVVALLVGVPVTTLVLMKKMSCGLFKRSRMEQYRVDFRASREVISTDGWSEGHTESSQNNQNVYHEQTVRKTVASEDSHEDEVPLLSAAMEAEIRVTMERENLLIERDCLILGEIIGQGHFGCVYKGYLQLPEEKAERIVAAKTLHRSDPRDMDVRQFVKEALTMKVFHHRHVMKLLGLCLSHNSLPLVVLPFMQHGDLLSYLRDHNNTPTVKDLVMFGVDIANGMCYLSELKFVHRDLAARNCMLDSDFRVKVADFGLSRDVYEKEYYSSSGKVTKLPVKWMAPESLELGIYTAKSDMWSYGVVLWELLTRGINPYPVVANWEILCFLKSDRRMAQPDYCPEEMYRIMRRCWLWNPDDRPTFGGLTEEIPRLLSHLEHTAGEKGRKINIETTYVNINNLGQGD